MVVKKMKRGFIGMLLFGLLLSACSTGNNDSRFVESGFSISNESNEPTPWLATAIKSSSRQESIASFTVHAGYISGFIDKWNDDAFESNPGYGKFALQRIIKDKNEMEISIYTYDLPDFYDENKYLVGVKSTDDGSDKIVSRDFTFKFEETIDFETISVEQGSIYYDICLVDDNNQVINDNLKCGISLGFLYFEKSGNQIIFSNSNSIFAK